MSSFALRGYRSSRRTFSWGFVPRYPYTRRGGMGGLLKVALLGTGTCMIARKLSHSNQSHQAGSHGGSQPVQPVPDPQVGAEASPKPLAQTLEPSPCV